MKILFAERCVVLVLLVFSEIFIADEKDFIVDKVSFNTGV